MHSAVIVREVFRCSVERAFRIPILGDARKIHSGYGMMPVVKGFEDDARWGKPGGSRKVIVFKNLFFREGEWALDTVDVREENKYWKWRIDEFKQWPLGFKKFEAEWLVKETEDGNAAVEYTYTLFSKNVLVFPFHWLFTKTLWKGYMKHAMMEIKLLAESDAGYFYE